MMTRHHFYRKDYAGHQERVEVREDLYVDDQHLCALGTYVARTAKGTQLLSRDFNYQLADFQEHAPWVKDLPSLRAELARWGYLQTHSEQQRTRSAGSDPGIAVLSPDVGKEAR